MRNLFFTVALAMSPVVSFFGTTLLADPVAVGDTITVINRPGSPGGEFGIALSADPTRTVFVSFCLEYNEPIDFVSTYYIAGISDHTDDSGPAPGVGDPISDETAWLYWAFRTGILESVYGYNGGTTYANALQKAIWGFEEERPVPTSGLAKFLYDLAIEQVADGWTNNGRVGVLNLLVGGAGGAHAQDQLVFLGDGQAVPEPATWMLLGLTLPMLLLALRRRAWNPAGQALKARLRVTARKGGSTRA